MAVRRIEDLVAWQRSRELTVATYRTSEKAEFARDFVLRDQIRAAALSVMSNIAEGFGYKSVRQFQKHLAIARASAVEVLSQLYLAHDLGYVSRAEFETLQDLCQQTTRIIAALAKSTRQL